MASTAINHTAACRLHSAANPLKQELPCSQPWANPRLVACCQLHNTSPCNMKCRHANTSTAHYIASMQCSELLIQLTQATWRPLVLAPEPSAPENVSPSTYNHQPAARSSVRHMQLPCRIHAHGATSNQAQHEVRLMETCQKKRRHPSPEPTGITANPLTTENRQVLRAQSDLHHSTTTVLLLSPPTPPAPSQCCAPRPALTPSSAPLARWRTPRSMTIDCGGC